MTNKPRRTPGQELGRRTIKKVRRYRLWDCSCGTKGINLNTCKQCPHCGRRKSDDNEGYRSSTPVNENYKHRGADITCQYCGSQNEKRFSCHGCGAELDPKFAEQVKRFPARTDQAWKELEVQVEQTGYLETATDTPWNDDVSQPPKPVRPSARTRVREVEQKTVRAAKSLKQPEVRRNPRTWFVIAGLLVALALVVSGGWWAYSKYTSLSDSYARVSSVSWSYTLPLEDYALRDKTNLTEDNAWRPPSGARNTESKKVVIDTVDVYSDVWVEKTCQKTEDNSYDDVDGTWVEQIDEVDYDCSGYENQKVGEEDVLANRWTYQIKEWQETAPLTASGQSHEVTFPLFTPTTTLRASDEATTEFVINFSYEGPKGNERKATRNVARLIWERVDVGQSYPAIVNGFGTLRAIKGIDAEYEQLARD